MKIFVQVIPDSDHHKAIVALMARCSFKEVNWTVIGTATTNIKILLTYECEKLYFDRYADSFYIQIKHPLFGPGDDGSRKYIFYSLRCLYGHECEKLSEFKKIALREDDERFEAKHF